MVFCGVVAADFLQMHAVQMNHAPAALTPQQEAVMGMPRLGAVLVERPLLRGHFMDKPLLGQLVQLAVHRGKPHGEAAVPQLV